jgi:hypothetical protein
VILALPEFPEPEFLEDGRPTRRQGTSQKLKPQQVHAAVDLQRLSRPPTDWIDGLD